MTTEIRSLVDLCINYIQNNAHLLAGQQLEQVLQLLAKKHAFNQSVLHCIDLQNWIKSLDLKASNITDEGLAKISGKET